MVQLVTSQDGKIETFPNSLDIDCGTVLQCSDQGEGGHRDYQPETEVTREIQIENRTDNPVKINCLLDTIDEVDVNYPLQVYPRGFLKILPHQSVTFTVTLTRHLLQGCHEFGMVAHIHPNNDDQNTQIIVPIRIRVDIAVVKVSIDHNVLDFGCILHNSGVHKKILKITNTGSLVAKVKLKVFNDGWDKVKLGRSMKKITLKLKDEKEVVVELDSSNTLMLQSKVVVAAKGPEYYVEIPVIAHMILPCFSLTQLSSSEPQNNELTIPNQIISILGSSQIPTPDSLRLTISNNENNANSNNFHGIEISPSSLLFVNNCNITHLSQSNTKYIKFINHTLENIRIILTVELQKELRGASMIIPEEYLKGEILAPSKTVSVKIIGSAFENGITGNITVVCVPEGNRETKIYETKIGVSSMTFPSENNGIISLPDIGLNHTSMTQLLLRNYSPFPLPYNFKIIKNKVFTINLPSGTLSPGQTIPILITFLGCKQQKTTMSKIECDIGGIKPRNELYLQCKTGTSSISLLQKGKVEIDVLKLESILTSQNHLMPIDMMITLSNEGDIASNIVSDDDTLIQFADQDSITVKPSTNSQKVNTLVNITSMFADATTYHLLDKVSGKTLEGKFAIEVKGPRMVVAEPKKPSYDGPSAVINLDNAKPSTECKTSFSICNYGNKVLKYGKVQVCSKSLRGINPESLILEHKGKPYDSSEVLELGDCGMDQWTLKFVTSSTSSPITIFINVTAVNCWTVDSSGGYRSEYTQCILFTGRVVDGDSLSRFKPKTLTKSYGNFPLDWLLYLSNYEIQTLELHRAVFAFMMVMLAEGDTKKLTMTLEGGGVSDIHNILSGDIYFKIKKEIKTNRKEFDNQFLSALNDEKDSSVIKLLSESIEENNILLMIARMFLSPSNDDEGGAHYQLIEYLGVNFLRLCHNKRVILARCDVVKTWKEFTVIINRRNSFRYNFVSDAVKNILNKNSTISMKMKSLLGAYCDIEMKKCTAEIIISMLRYNCGKHGYCVGCQSCNNLAEGWNSNDSKILQIVHNDSDADCGELAVGYLVETFKLNKVHTIIQSKVKFTSTSLLTHFESLLKRISSKDDQITELLQIVSYVILDKKEAIYYILDFISGTNISNVMKEFCNCNFLTAKIWNKIAKITGTILRYLTYELSKDEHSELLFAFIDYLLSEDAFLQQGPYDLLSAKCNPDRWKERKMKLTQYIKKISILRLLNLESFNAIVTISVELVSYFYSISSPLNVLLRETRKIVEDRGNIVMKLFDIISTSPFNLKAAIKIMTQFIKAYSRNMIGFHHNLLQLSKDKTNIDAILGCLHEISVITSQITYQSTIRLFHSLVVKPSDAWDQVENILGYLRTGIDIYIDALDCHERSGQVEAAKRWLSVVKIEKNPVVRLDSYLKESVLHLLGDLGEGGGGKSNKLTVANTILVNNSIPSYPTDTFGKFLNLFKVLCFQENMDVVSNDGVFSVLNILCAVSLILDDRSSELQRRCAAFLCLTSIMRLDRRGLLFVSHLKHSGGENNHDSLRTNSLHRKVEDNYVESLRNKISSSGGDLSIYGVYEEKEEIDDNTNHYVPSDSSKINNINGDMLNQESYNNNLQLEDHEVEIVAGAIKVPYSKINKLSYRFSKAFVIDNRISFDERDQMQIKSRLDEVMSIYDEAHEALGITELADSKREATLDNVVNNNSLFGADKILVGVEFVMDVYPLWKQAFEFLCRASVRGWNPGDDYSHFASQVLRHGLYFLHLIVIIRSRLSLIGTTVSMSILTKEEDGLRQCLGALDVNGLNDHWKSFLNVLGTNTRKSKSSKSDDWEIIGSREGMVSISSANKLLLADTTDDPFEHLRSVKYNNNEMDISLSELEGGEMIPKHKRINLKDIVDFGLTSPPLSGHATHSHDDSGNSSSGNDGHYEFDSVRLFGSINVATITVDDILQSSKVKQKPANESIIKVPKRNIKDLQEIDISSVITRKVESAANKVKLSEPNMYSKRIKEVTVTSDHFENDQAEVEVEKVLGKLKIELDAAAIRRKLNSDDLQESYIRAGMNQKRLNDSRVIALPKEFQPVKGKQEKWTYQKLAESSTISSMSEEILDACRDVYAEHLRHYPSINIEWCFVFDNSGSMVRIADPCAEALVLIVETIRKLEFAFAVGTLGAKARLTKKIDEPFSYQLGEKLLASFTYNESTNIASCAAAVAKDAFTAETSLNCHTHRYLVVITDGLSREMCDSNFRDIRQNNDVELVFLHTTQMGGSEFANNLEIVMKNVITNQLYFNISHDDILVTNTASDRPTLASTVASLLVKCLALAVNKDKRNMKSLSNVHTNYRSSLYRSPTWTELYPTTNLWPIQDRVGSIDIHKALRDGMTLELPLMYNCSAPNTILSPLPEDSEVVVSNLPINQLLLSSERVNEMSDAVNNLRSFFDDNRELNDEILKQAEVNWRTAARSISSLTSDLLVVFEDYVFPNNVYSRRKADFKGTQLHMPGLIKAVVSDFNYKKIFSSKSGGGRREYCISVVLDISQSMDGHLLDCAMESLVMFVEALQEIGLKEFSVILFGSNVQLIKSGSEEWDARCIASLLAPTRLRCSEHTSTKDAEGIELALHLLKSSSLGNRGPKKVFVFSDGFTSSGINLLKVLHNAKESDIEVTGICIGICKSNVSEVYESWITAAIPRALPQALKELFERKMSGGNTMSVGGISQKRINNGWKGLRSSLLGVTQDSPEYVEKVLADRFQRFSSLHNQLSSEREMTLVRGDNPAGIVIDIVFVVDITGSMAPILSRIKADILGIVAGTNQSKGVIDSVKEKYPEMSLHMRCALIGFRDTCDGPNQYLRFTGIDSQSNAKGENVNMRGNFHDITSPHLHGQGLAAFRTQVESLVASGGGDIAEDLAKPLEIVSGWDDWRGRAKFILLFTDAPAHGNSFLSVNYQHRQGTIDNERQSSHETHMRFANALTTLVKKDIKTIFCSCNPEETSATTNQLTAITQNIITTANSQRDKANDYFDVLELFQSIHKDKGGAVSGQGQHVVFVLDESGSMSGGPWNELVKAYNVFIQRRLMDQGCGDIISIVQFDDTARCTSSKVPISSAPQSLQFNGGGTCFYPAIMEAQSCLLGTNAQQYSPMIVFMSDGESNDTEEAGIELKKICVQYLGIKVHVIAFGNGASHANLRRLVEISGGDFHSVATGELAMTFAEIARTLAPSDKLFQEIGTRITEAVTDKLILDYL